jgi:hypothetical protein
VIYKLRDLLGVEAMGGTMRLGAYPCRLKEGTLARQVYGGAAEVQERHRHRYEVNQKYLARLQEAGLVVSGLSPDGKFVEMVELPGHPWFLGCQFHPEYQSKPTEPHPLFISFIAAALAERRRRGGEEGERQGAVAALAGTLSAAVSAAGGESAASPTEASASAAAPPVEADPDPDRTTEPAGLPADSRVGAGERIA